MDPQVGPQNPCQNLASLKNGALDERRQDDQKSFGNLFWKIKTVQTFDYFSHDQNLPSSKKKIMICEESEFRWFDHLFRSSEVTRLKYSLTITH